MAREIIKMESTGTNAAGKLTRTFYTTTKNKKSTPDKFEFMRYDPLAVNPKTGKRGMHVPFKETKV